MLVNETEKYFIKSSENGNFDIVKNLVECGVNVHANYNLALRLSSSHGYLRLVTYLVKSGADVHANNNDALRLSSRYGHL
jgi:hypothetical protein